MGKLPAFALRSQIKTAYSCKIFPLAIVLN